MCCSYPPWLVFFLQFLRAFSWIFSCFFLNIFACLSFELGDIGIWGACLQPIFVCLTFLRRSVFLHFISHFLSCPAHSSMNQKKKRFPRPFCFVFFSNSRFFLQKRVFRASTHFFDETPPQNRTKKGPKTGKRVKITPKRPHNDVKTMPKWS